MNVGVILVAAGRGTRLGADRPKGLVALTGTPIVAHALRRVLACRDVTEVVVVAPPAAVDDFRGVVDQLLAEGSVPARTAPVTVVSGGAERSDSVARGLRALSPGVGIVLVHDAARALTPATVFERVIHAVRHGHAAVVPGLAVTDTIKQVGPDDRVTGTLDRNALRAVQTPQGFLRETLTRAHELGGIPVTDDAGLVEQHGGAVHVVPGDPRAAKITTAADLRTVEAWLTDDLPTDDLPVTARRTRPVLLVLAGLPGVGKTSTARAWASRRGAVHVRIDTLEQTLVRAGAYSDVGVLGYAVGYEVAADQLRLGLDVVADSVNPVGETRQSWADVADRCGARLVEVELVCSDPAEHRRRVEDRPPDISGHRLPTWDSVRDSDYQHWTGAPLTIDTGTRDLEAVVALIEEAVG